ncbi:MAG: GYD domain-containing protein [Desulfobacterales bacterium]|nr:GYD domain-containing protein [Desulfobacterales bacterium]
MGTFFMFGKYSSEALKEISAERTDKANNLIKKFGGEVISMYALLGKKDLVFIVNLPGIEQAMKASVALSKLTGISFTTSPAVTVEEFDKMIAEL